MYLSGPHSKRDIFSTWSDVKLLVQNSCDNGRTTQQPVNVRMIEQCTRDKVSWNRLDNAHFWLGLRLWHRSKTTVLDARCWLIWPTSLLTNQLSGTNVVWCSHRRRIRGGLGGYSPPTFQSGGGARVSRVLWPDKNVFCLSDALIWLFEKPKVKKFSRLRREYSHSLIDSASGRGGLRTF